MPTGPQWLVVDAHNAIHQDPELRALMHDPEHARQALEQRLAGHPRCVVVHDGGPGGLARRVVRHGLTVLYAGRQSADDVIIDWLQRHQVRAVVASADGALRRRARAMGATLMDIKEFLKVHTPGSLDVSDRGPPPTHEVDGWMRAFGVDGSRPDFGQPPPGAPLHRRLP